MRYFVLLLLVLTCHGASAATKCIKPPQCSVEVVRGLIDWVGTCTDGSTFNGLAGCSNVAGAVQYETISKLTLQNSSTDNSGNRYCWCRMVSPAVSDWVYLADFGDSADCSYWCSFQCGNSYRHQPGLNAAIVSTLH